MSENTKIEWCDHTFNPWIGCTKVGPGCDNCYAAAWDRRFAVSGHAMHWGPGQARSRTKTWGDPVRWNKYAANFFFEHGRRQRVFCASLADVFDNAVDPMWRADLFWLIKQTPNLDWLLLTKRIGNAKTMMADAIATNDPKSEWVMPLPNVWLGATIVNQEEACRDIPKLLAVPAAKRFLSIEPLLGPVEIPNFLCEYPEDEDGAPYQSHIDWVIVGGESGPNARPMHPDWSRSLRDQCQEAGVPFLFKQWGDWAPHRTVAGGDEGGDVRRGHVRYLVGDGREPDGHFRKGDAAVARVGKKVAGRLLDGITHDGYPS